MIIQFSLPYRTAWGQRLAVCGAGPALGDWQAAAAAPHELRRSGRPLVPRRGAARRPALL
ncbi:MAG: carbohydrate-binding module family 20 domain-containing protein [Hymenobacter sp.]